MIVGYSTHLYLPIRAAQHPAVNEGAPATWDKLRDLLERSDDVLSADVPGVEDGIDAAKSFKRFGANQAVSVGDDANSMRAASSEREVARSPLAARCSLMPRYSPSSPRSCRNSAA